MTTIPLFPLGTPLFPGMVLPLHIFEERYRELVRDLLTTAESGGPAIFGVVSTRTGNEVGPDTAGAGLLADVGCLADVRAVGALPDGRFELVTLGMHRFHLDRVIAGEKPYLQGDVTWLDEQEGDDPAELVKAVKTTYGDYRRALDRATGRTSESEHLPKSPTMLSYAVGAAMVLPARERQRVLAAQDTGDRLRLLLQLLTREHALISELGLVGTFEAPMGVGSPN